MDANALIEPWNQTYKPSIHLFRNLWRKLVWARENDLIRIAQPIFDEIDPIPPDDEKNLTKEQCRERYPLRCWLMENGFRDAVEPISEEVEMASLELEKKYEINPNTKKGASKNDIRLIAYARYIGGCVVTLENQQPTPPPHRSGYKIPLICKEENVRCINFVEFLEEIDK